MSDKVTITTLATRRDFFSWCWWLIGLLITGRAEVSHQIDREELIKELLND